MIMIFIGDDFTIGWNVMFCFFFLEAWRLQVY
jgi:hypothetical protein